ncbi:hypothetical protein Poly51_05860 [Rubripirellula tenax]|uniref:Uncharacterized protein n=1 Tax=Rubripirellula tenax TaxID=2528015 RepID=A0A5C6FFM3_9BACT|nr:hypothetical protein [Rubripirellula tenax]TWU60311.1 hypothetical protein Poly51_05860 [Rubripirellula tenax]
MDAEKLREGIIFRIAYVDDPTSTSFSTARDIHFRTDGGVMLYPEAAISLWQRIAALPTAEQMRCHTPHYAIHLNFGAGVFYTAAICFECNNISVSSSGDYSWQTFDGQSEAAQSILAEFKARVPDDDTET